MSTLHVQHVLGSAPTAASLPGADAAGPVFRLILAIAIVLFVLLVAALAIVLIRYRRRAGAEVAEAPADSPRLQAAWLVVSVLIAAVVLVAGLRGYARLVTAPEMTYDVWVTAGNSAWTFQHRNGKVQDDGRLFVPADRPVRLIMTSRDLTYAAFLPEFRIRQSIVPGRETALWFSAPPGDHRLIGAIDSGADFGQMNAVVTAYGPDEFAGALDSIAYWLDAYTNEDLYKAGYRLYPNCVSCHTLDGSALIGPSFRETHLQWGQMRLLEDGREVVIDEEYARRSILAPDTDIVAGYADQQMTNFTGQLRDREVLALIEFIRRLDEAVDEQGAPLPGIEETGE